MNGLAGWVALGVVVLVLAYILPAVIRSRQVVVDSRVEDRYSDDLRIVATAGPRSAATASTSRVFVHARRPNEESPMTSTADRQLAAADARRLAAARAARAAASSRRAASARRRLAITVALLLATAVAWVGVAVLTWPVVAAIGATVVLGGVVVLGRRAATAGDAADERWERELATIAAHARDRAVTRRPGAPRLRVDVDPTSLIETGEIAVAPVVAPRRTSVRDAWTPVPVPPPAYTLKQSAPRREVAPLVAEEPAGTEQLDAMAPAAPETAEERTATVEAEPAMNLQQVLARRRAVG